MSVNFYIVSFLAQLCVLCLGSSVSRPGYAYYAQLRGSLKLHSEPADWLSARVACHNEDALLASPWTADFTSTIHALQATEATEDQSLPVVFSGIQLRFPEGVYKTYVKGVPGILTDLERCGVFYQNGTTGDANCKERLPFFCYLPGNAPAQTHASPDAPKTSSAAAPTASATAPTTTSATAPTPARASSCGLEYEVSNRTGQCYKLHTRAVSWADAIRTCVGEGARLAVPNSAAEETALVELFEQHPDASIQDADYADWVSLGIYWDRDEWRTVDNQTLAQAGHAHWQPDQPTHGDFYPYVYMDRDGELNNGLSYLKFPFICEKTLHGNKAAHEKGDRILRL